MSVATKARIFMIFGSMLLAAALLTADATMKILRESGTAPGVVVHLDAGGSHPEIRFTDNRGEVVSYPQGGLVKGWKVGDRMTVRYRPKAAGRSATIDHRPAVWTETIFLTALGVLFMLVALFPADRDPGRDA